MWWQFKEVHPSIKLHLCHCVDIQLFVRVDRHKKSTNICLQGERPHTARKSVPALEWQLLKEESSKAGHYVKTTEKDGTEWEKKSTTTSLLPPQKTNKQTENPHLLALPFPNLKANTKLPKPTPLMVEFNNKSKLRALHHHSAGYYQHLTRFVVSLLNETKAGRVCSVFSVLIVLLPLQRQLTSYLGGLYTHPPYYNLFNLLQAAWIHTTNTCTRPRTYIDEVLLVPLAKIVQEGGLTGVGVQKHKVLHPNSVPGYQSPFHVCISIIFHLFFLQHEGGVIRA